jgi:hypothetical protein
VHDQVTGVQTCALPIFKWRSSLQGGVIISILWRV